MPSQNTTQQKVPLGKLDDGLLPCVQLYSMEKPHSTVHVGHKAVLSRDQTGIDESRTVNLHHQNTTCKLLPIHNHSSSQQKHHIGVTACPKPPPWGTRPYAGHGWWTLMFLGVLFACAHCQSDFNLCAPGMMTLGRTWPQGDIMLESNQSLKIYCILNDVSLDPRWKALTSSDLVFFRNDKLLGPEYTTIVNSTTALLHVENVSPSDDVYYCRAKLNHAFEAKYEAVCSNRVVVGFKPQKPQGFSCHSKNWKKLICTWNPEQNFIPTNFSLQYKIPGSTSRRRYFDCPVRRSSLPLNGCKWDSNSNPEYPRDYANLTFLLNITNVLGSRIVGYEFNHWANVILARPEGLTVVNQTYSSVLLSWYVSHQLRHFPPALEHKISYRSQYDLMHDWKTKILIKNDHTEDVFFNLTNLPYANAVYDIRVSIRSAEAVSNNTWSGHNEVTVKTASTVPSLPPKTDVGSFEIIENSGNRDVYIYWQTIPQKFENGDNFTYRVTRVKANGTIVNIQPSEKTETFARFKGFSLQSYEFEIVTVNSNGMNNQPAVVHVPRSVDVVPGPTNFRKIAFGDGVYELSWIPNKDSRITNYTIFWCANDGDRSNQCTEYLYWENVPSHRNSFQIRVPDASEVYRFAISANTADSSSGMKWANCTVLKRDVVGKVTSVRFDHATSDTLQVSWTLECSDQIHTIVGFVIYYCPVMRPLKWICNPTMIKKVKGDRHTSNGELDGLQPYTTYMIIVAALSEHGEGARSDPLHADTLPTISSPPWEVSVVGETNTTLTIEWQPPAVMNGAIRYYTVFWNGNSTIVETGTTLQIRDLQPHTSYKISVSAMTVGESRRSTIVGKTLIGVPGKIDRPVIHFTKSSRVKISWKPPRNPGGNLDYYEILTHDGFIYSKITELEKELVVGDCAYHGRDPQVFQFRMRAVNMGRNEERFEGPWSDPTESVCSTNDAVSIGGFAAKYLREDIMN